VSYVAAHDGFTLADATAYEHKHNLGNGEGNRDGHDDNRSWNHGTEGPSEDPGVLAARRRSARNLLATTLLSTGVPMLAAGDELGRTQRGNNNAYCRDDEVSWLDWDLAPWQQDLLATTTHLLALRRELAVLRRRTFVQRRPDGTHELTWFAPDAAPMDDGRWHDPYTRTLQLLLRGHAADDHGPAADSVLLVLHGAAHDGLVWLPGAPWADAWSLLLDTVHERPGDPGPPVTGERSVAARTLQLYRAVDLNGAPGPA
jgi:isoamylase